MAPIFSADMKVFALNTTVYPSNKKYISHKYEIKLYLAQKKTVLDLNMTFCLKGGCNFPKYGWI